MDKTHDFDSAWESHLEHCTAENHRRAQEAAEMDCIEEFEAEAVNKIPSAQSGSWFLIWFLIAAAIVGGIEHGTLPVASGVTALAMTVPMIMAAKH